MSAEARDALAVAPLGPLVDEARANHVRWQHEAEYLEECGRELCIGAKLLLWPDIENPRDSIPLPDGWVLARREDAEDGAVVEEAAIAKALTYLRRQVEVMGEDGECSVRRISGREYVTKDDVLLLVDERLGFALFITDTAAARKATDALGGVG